MMEEQWDSPMDEGAVLLPRQQYGDGDRVWDTRLVPSAAAVRRRRLRLAHGAFACVAVSSVCLFGLLVASRWQAYLSRAHEQPRVVDMPPPTSWSPALRAPSPPTRAPSSDEALDGGGGANASRPHIMLVVADDLGYNDVGWASTDLGRCTPTLDAMRRDGIELAALYALPTCTPSRGALLTGKYPIKLGLQHWQLEPAQPWALGANETTLSEWLLAEGYATALVGKWHLGHYAQSALPTRRGFSHFFGFYSGGENYFTRVSEGACVEADDVSERESANASVWCFRDAADGEGRAPLDTRHSTYAFAAAAERYVRDHANDHDAGGAKPLLLDLSLPNSHVPLLAPAETYRAHDATLRAIPNAYRRAFAALTIVWDEALANVSRAVASEFDEEKRPTLWLVLSDNGGAPEGGGSNWPLRGSKHYLYEGGVRVRGVVYSASTALIPAQRRGQLYNGLMHVVDLAPTLLRGVLGHTEAFAQDDVDGLDHWSALRGEDEDDGLGPRNELLINMDYLDSSLEYLGYLRAGIVSCAQNTESELDQAAAARTRTRRRRASVARSAATTTTCWKALFNVEEVLWYDTPKEPYTLVTPVPRDFATSALYNLTADPTERVDLSLEFPDVFQALHAHVWREYLPMMRRAENRDDDPAAYEAWRADGDYVGPWLIQATDPCQGLATSRALFEAELGLVNCSHTYGHQT